MKQTVTRGSYVAVEDYGYDELNRLQTAARTGATALSPYTERYCYDRYGNRAVTSGSTAVPGTTGMTPVVADVDCAVASSINNATVAGLFPGNRWTAGAPDTVGNVVNDGRNTLQYDVEGRLYRSSRTIGSTAYEEISYYDGDGRRVRRETKSGPVTVSPTPPTNTVYVYDASGALAAEYGTGGPQVTGLRYLTADHLGSTRLVTDAAGAEVDRHDFRPFGQEWPERPIVLNTLFTGKERDAESGLDYFGARYLSAAQGRFTSPDRVEGQLENPQSWNKYAYVKNNPLALVDPDGNRDIPAQLQFVNASLATDPTLLEVIKSSNNFSQQGFQNALLGGGLNNLNTGPGSILRGLAGEAVALDSLRTISPATSQPTMLSGVLPDIAQVLPSGSFKVPFLPIEIQRQYSLPNVATASGTRDAYLGTGTQFALYEVKSGISASSISAGVNQVAATAGALKAAKLPGVSVLMVDQGAWNQLSPAARASALKTTGAAGAYIQIQPGLAQAAAARAQAAVDEAKRQQQP